MVVTWTPLCARSGVLWKFLCSYLPLASLHLGHASVDSGGPRRRRGLRRYAGSCGLEVRGHHLGGDWNSNRSHQQQVRLDDESCLLQLGRGDPARRGAGPYGRSARLYRRVATGTRALMDGLGGTALGCAGTDHAPFQVVHVLLLLPSSFCKMTRIQARLTLTNN
uniref:Secreted protein n=1 Tax=Timema bartmani TaxID=61472 RepID=A0A7R9I558_9NEOP|nr:unnamed protein product [Timema bartmani]